MTPPRPLPAEVLAYLRVDDYLRTLLDARALKTAFEIDLIDHLRTTGSTSSDTLILTTGADPLGLRILLGLLASNRVTTAAEGTLGLDPAFQDALRFRDVLEAKLDFANLVAPDILDLFTPLLFDSHQFMQKARLFRLFDYGKCLEVTPEARASTQRWVRFTSALTKYEAAACLACFDIQPYRSLVDVGGNSGEFSLRLCRANPRLKARVVDLPVVCSIGREHVSREPESARIQFVPANALTDPLPEGADLITFKSVLHDWPEEAALQFLSKAAHALKPGGTLLVFERAAHVPSSAPGYSNLPILLFFRFYRSHEFYEQALRRLGFEEISVVPLHLEMPFFLVSGRRPG